MFLAMTAIKIYIAYGKNRFELKDNKSVICCNIERDRKCKMYIKQIILKNAYNIIIVISFPFALNLAID